MRSILNSPCLSRFRPAAVGAVVLLAFAARASAQEPEGWRQAYNAHVAKNYEASIAGFQKLHDSLAPNHPFRGPSAYNAACGLALAGGKADQAFAWLEKALAAGFGTDTLPGAPQRDRDLIRGDSDLDSIRSDPRFAKIVEAVDAATAKAAPASKPASRPALNIEEETREALLYSPETLAADKAAPLIVLCHGAGQDKKGFLETYWKDVADAAGVRLASVSGGRAHVAGRAQWFALGGPSRYAADADAIEARLKAAVEQAKKAYAVDPNRVYLSGFSQGATVALLAGVRNPEAFRGVVAVAGSSDPAILDPAAAKAAGKLRTILIAGTNDATSLQAMTKAQESLTAAGVAAELRTFPIGHTFPRERVKELSAALATLEGKAPPADATRGGAPMPASGPSSGAR